MVPLIILVVYRVLCKATLKDLKKGVFKTMAVLLAVVFHMHKVNICLLLGFGGTSCRKKDVMFGGCEMMKWSIYSDSTTYNAAYWWWHSQWKEYSYFWRKKAGLFVAFTYTINCFHSRTFYLCIYLHLCILYHHTDAVTCMHVDQQWLLCSEKKNT